MDREQILKAWTIDGFGGPEIENFYLAKKYAELSFDNGFYINLLKIKLNNLKKFIADSEPACLKDLEELADISFKIEHVNEAVRQIIKLRVFARDHLRYFLDLGAFCPFCLDKLEFHDELFNCPR